MKFKFQFKQKSNYLWINSNELKGLQLRSNVDKVREALVSAPMLQNEI